jgi:hypothetical protein
MIHSDMQMNEGWRSKEMIVVTGSVGVNSPLVHADTVRCVEL